MSPASVEMETQQMGYWEPHTSSQDWCEPNYVYSYYIAEWWNTLSSFCIVLAGAWGVYKWSQYRYHRRLLLGSIILVIVGLGSVVFHAAEGQALDELPMIYGTLIFSYPLWEIESRSGERQFSWLIPTMVSYSILFTISYIWLPQFFWIFIVIYVVSVTLLLIQSFYLSMQDGVPSLTRKIAGGAFAVYTFAFLFVWIPEHLFCENVQWLHTHAIWHFGSAIGTYLFMTFATYETHRRQLSTPVSVRYDGFGFIQIPYVHLEEIKYS